MEWFIKCLKQYADFNGRARRKEYWMFTLFVVIFFIVAAILDNLLGTTFKFAGVSAPYGWIYLLFAFAMILPSLAVVVRRLHDIGKSGWYYFLVFIPVVGGIILLIWYCKNSQPGENQYGPNPKE